MAIIIYSYALAPAKKVELHLDTAELRRHRESHMTTTTVRCPGCSSGLPQCSSSSRWPTPSPSQRLLILSREAARAMPRSAITARVASQKSELRAIFSSALLGSMEEASRLFQTVENPGVSIWNVMIRGYVRCGRFEEAIEFYWEMQARGIRPDKLTYTFVIKSFSETLKIMYGLSCHGKVMKSGLQSDVFISNSLIVMYAKFGDINSAQQMFYEMPARDLVSWNSMIGAYVSSEDWERALCCLRDMCEISSLKPDRIGLITSLQACSIENYRNSGKEIHCYALRNGYELDVKVCTSLIDMYCKLGNMIAAERLFNSRVPRNVVTWNALIDGYKYNNQPGETFRCIIGMQHEEVYPDAVTMLSLLSSCCQSSCLSLGKGIHGASLRRGFLPHSVLETSLIAMYIKCGDLTSANLVFTRMADKNLVSWNTMISACVYNDQNHEAVELFLNLLRNCVKPDIYTISSVVSALCVIGLLQHARQIHGYSIKLGYNSDTFSLNSIIYLYAKCGDLQTSKRIFENMIFKDIVSWNTIIMACAIHGDGINAMKLFSRMQGEGMRPNGSTFVSLLSACSISGLNHEGWMFFDMMQENYTLAPQIEHYGRMVDIIGRTGDLDFAVRFIEGIPLVPTCRIWGSLLSASRKHKRIDIAEYAANQIFRLKHDNTGCYIILRSLYTDGGRLDDAEKVRSSMKNLGLVRTIPRSMVLIKNKSYTLINDDRSHVTASLTRSVSTLLSKKIGEEVDYDSSEFSLQKALAKKMTLPCQHSVRLAVCYGLISSSPRTPVLVKKNVRICDDCHVALQRISKVCRRHIIVGDSSIYHNFREGSCSCGEYW